MSTFCVKKIKSNTLSVKFCDLGLLSNKSRNDYRYGWMLAAKFSTPMESAQVF